MTNTVAVARRQVSLPPTVDERRPPIKAPARQASVEPISKIAADAAARARSVSVEPENLTPKATSPVLQSFGESREPSVEPCLTLVSCSTEFFRSFIDGSYDRHLQSHLLT